MSDSVGWGKKKRSVASIGTPVEQPKRQKKEGGSLEGGSGSGTKVTEKEEEALSKLVEFLFRSDSPDDKEELEENYRLDDGEYKPTSSMPLRTSWGRKSLRPDDTIDWHLLLRGDANMDGADCEEGDSFWVRAHWANRDFAKGVAEVEDLNPWNWQKHVSTEEWAKAESQEGLSERARKLLAEYERDRGGRGLRPEAFWDELGEEDLFRVEDLPLKFEVTPEGLLRNVEGGGIYLGVGFLKAELKALYVGRTVSFASRLLDHLKAIHKDGGAGKSGTLFYDALAGCDKLRQEGGLFANRRKYGLDNIGDDAIGCNATPCTEPPTALTTGQAILNPEHVSAITPLWFAHRHLRETMAKTWDEDEVKGANDALRAAHDDWLVVFQRLIKEDKLRFLDSTFQRRDRILIRQWLSCQPPQDLVHAVCSDRWLLKLEAGSTSSVNALTEEDKGVFEGIAITVTSLDGSVESVWRFSRYHLVGAPCKLMTYMLEALSEAQQQRRRAAYEAVVKAKTESCRGIRNFDDLTEHSRKGVLGEHFINDKSLLVWVGSRVGARLSPSRIPALRKLAKIVGQGAVPIRFGIWGPSDLLLSERNFNGAPSEWTVEILPVGSLEWMRLLFPFAVSRKTSNSAGREDSGMQIVWTMMAG